VTGGPGTVGTDTTADDVAALLDQAAEVYREHPDVAARLREQRRRLGEPLRVALVGRVKAGKSMLLNAMLGERLAPTDAGECTRVVALYRHGTAPRVVLVGTDGGERPLPITRGDDGLRLDLAGTAPEEVAWLTVDWPATRLAPVTLVDTPGLSSLTASTSERTTTFIAADDHLPGADAVLFLTRRIQPDDVTFLASFQAVTGSSGSHLATITVLSRADEVGAGRLDALATAGTVARRMAEDPAVRAVTRAVVPVSGLLALAGRTLRQADFVALRSLARLDRAELEAALLTADRFCRPELPVPVSHTVRVQLLDRLGLFGIRLSIALVLAGVPDSATLADELVRRSGLVELERLVGVHFASRGARLKEASALRLVDAVLRERDVPGTDPLWGELERLQLAGHDLAELDLLARSRAPDGPLPASLRAEGERLLGAHGSDVAARLGLPADSSPAHLRTAAFEALARWRAAAADPAADRGTVDAVGVVIHSCEAMLAELAGSAGGPPEPGAGGAGEQGHEAEDG
jgi:hypothetical protein